MSAVAVGLSESLDPVEAAAEAAERARAGLEGECDLCLVFAPGPHLPMAKWVLSEVHDALEPGSLIGCGAAGTLAAGREMENEPGLVVWAASLPEASLETIHVTAEREGEDFRLLGLPPDLAPLGDGSAAAAAPSDRALLLLADPYSFPSEVLLGALQRSQPGMPVLGGLSSAAVAGGSVLLQDGELHSGGAVAALVSGAEVIPCVSQGAVPVGPEMTITAASGNVIGELASKNAMERIGEALSSLPERERELAASGVLLGVVIDENRPDHERGDFLVRPIVGADRDSGAVAIGQRVRVGQTVRLHVRDAGSADEDLRAALRDQAEAMGEAGAAGALLFTCNGRGSQMFELPDHDALAIQDGLGAPAAGFFCAGEIGPVGGRNFLHGFSATIAVFPNA